MQGGPAEPELDILLRRDELCIGYRAGVAMGLQLTSTRSEWLGEIERAFQAAVERHGGPVPLLAIYRLDPRYPLEMDFDANLGELVDTLGRIGRCLRAVGVVLEFEGLIAVVMRMSIKIVAAKAQSTLPIAVLPSVPQAVRWLEREEGASIDMRRVILATRHMRYLLGLE